MVERQGSARGTRGRGDRAGAGRAPCGRRRALRGPRRHRGGGGRPEGSLGCHPRPSSSRPLSRARTSSSRRPAPGDPRERLLEAEPEPVVETDRTELADPVRAFGDLADMKTPWTHGHSAGVAKLAGAAAKTLRLDARARLQTRALRPPRGPRQGRRLEPDLGETRSPDCRRVGAGRMHSYHSERILAQVRRPCAAGPRGGHASRAMDGSGYYRSCARKSSPPAVRILAAADAFHAITQARPHAGGARGR